MTGKNIYECINTAEEQKTLYMSPWLTSHSINLIFAPTGVGKSMIGIYLALCCSGGADFMRFPSIETGKVLYIDGEMGHARVGKRLKAFLNNQNVNIDPENFKVISYEDFPDGMPNLSNPDSFNRWEATFKPYDLIFVDNLDTCTLPLSPRDDDLSMWLRMRPWLLKIKQSGKCLVLIHHSNKAGEIYGTSKIGNTLEIGISLSKPQFSPKDETSFKMSFFKSRDGHWPQLYPTWVEMDEDMNIRGRAYADFLREKIEVVQDLSLTEQSEVLGVSRQDILRIKNNLVGDFI